MSGGSIGYEFYAEVRRTDTSATYPLLITSDSLARVRTILATAGAAGNDLDTAGSQYAYDYDKHEGSLNFELNEDNWPLVQFVLDSSKRQQDFEVFISPQSGEEYLYEHCLWTSFSLNASEGSFVTCDLGVTGFSRDDDVNSEQFITDISRCGYTGGFDEDAMPIPFWNTYIPTAAFADYKIVDWSLSVENNVQEFPICESIALATAGDPRESPNAPTHKPGRPTAQFSGTMWGRDYPDDIPGTINIQLYRPFNGVLLGTLGFYDSELDGTSKNFTGKNAAMNLTATYSTFGQFPTAA